MKIRATIFLFATTIFCSCNLLHHKTGEKSFGGNWGKTANKIENASANSVAQNSNGSDSITQYASGAAKHAEMVNKPLKKKQHYLLKIANHIAPQIDSTIKKNQPPVKDKKTIERIGLYGFFALLVSLGLIAIPGAVAFSLMFMAAAVVMGIIGLIRIKNNPGKYWGKGFALVVIVVPIILFTLALAYGLFLIFLFITLFSGC